MGLFVAQVAVQYPSTFKILVQKITDKEGNALPLETTKYNLRLYIQGDPDRDYIVSFDGTERVNSFFDKAKNQLFVIFENYEFKIEGMLVCEDRTELPDGSSKTGAFVNYSTNFTGLQFAKRVSSGKNPFLPKTIINGIIQSNGCSGSSISITGGDVE